MNKPQRILALTAFAALGLSLTACGPSPEDTCQHVIDLMTKELETKGTQIPDEKLKKSLETCVERANKAKEMKGALEYKKEASCVLEAESLDAVNECAKQGDSPPK